MGCIRCVVVEVKGVRVVGYGVGQVGLHCVLIDRPVKQKAAGIEWCSTATLIEPRVEEANGYGGSL